MFDLSGKNYPPYVTEDSLKTFIESAFREDIGDGDHSSLASIPENASSKAKLLVKDAGTLAGVDLALMIFSYFDKRLTTEVLLNDGDQIKKGDIAFYVEGPSRSILSCERLALNCMQRMSGVATYTRHLNKLIEGTKARLKDTRKTTPNFRLPEKWAVAIGGGVNHRFALYDMIMLKDNHADMAGGIAKAVANTKQYLVTTKKNLRIEVETRNLDEVRQALDAGGVDTIMLDNMSPSLMKEAVEIVGGRCLTEASGGITEQTIREVAMTGVDFISVGALTHSVRSLDLSLKFTS